MIAEDKPLEAGDLILYISSGVRGVILLVHPQYKVADFAQRWLITDKVTGKEYIGVWFKGSTAQTIATTTVTKYSVYRNGTIIGNVADLFAKMQEDFLKNWSIK